jgi:hypothetical protein
MQVSDQLRRFLNQQHILDWIDENKYNRVYEEYFNYYEIISDLTEFLMETCGINPLVGMKCVPSGFGYKDLSQIEIPSNITTIKQNAFYRNINLTVVQLSEKVIDIEQGAFSFCVKLDNIVLPSNLDRISNYMFQECTGLTNIVIPSGVTSIGSYSFHNCSRLQSIRFEGTIDDWKRIRVGEKAFDNVATSVVRCTDGVIRTQ